MLVDVIEGVPVPVDPVGWSLAWAKHNGHRCDVDIRRYRLSRSAQQNRYYWGVPVAILGEELGYYKDEMDRALCHKFLGDVDMETGLMRIRGTSELNSAEFEEFLSRVRMWAAQDLGVFIPQPNETT